MRPLLFAAGIGIGGCTAGLSSASTPTSDAPAVISCEARHKLDELTSAGSRLSQRRKQNVRLELSAPFMPAAIEARGAVAMDPEAGDLRMILLGPGGATAIDLWMHGPRYRFDVPAIEKTLRGDAGTKVEQKKGLPVDFLGWWMLHPLRGEVLVADLDDRGLSFVLRDRVGEAVAYVDAELAPAGTFHATRTTWAGDEKIDEETLSASSLGCGRVEYTQASTSLHVVAECEGESPDVPAKAFVDPDAARAGGPT